MGVVNQLRVGLSEGEGVGGGAVWIAEEDRVVEDLHTVKPKPSPLVVDGDSKIIVPLTASYVRLLC